MATHSSTPPPGHPLPAAVERVHAALGEVVDVQPWSLSGPDTLETLVEITRAQSRLAELEARLLAHARTIEATSDQAVTPAVWLANATNATRPEAHSRTRLASRLTAHPLVAAAMSRGDVLVSQAHVICRAIDELPQHADLRDQATHYLIGRAEHHDAKELKSLGRRVLEIVDPDAADAHEAELLEREEREQSGRTRLSMRQDPDDGTWRGRFVLPALEGDMLRKALMALAAPKHVRAEHGAGAYDHERPTPHRLGDAFAEYVRRYPTEQVPDAGGTSATIVVTMTLDTLLGGLKAAQVDTGTLISPGLARRLACQAALIPAVFGRDGQVLDLGRKARFHTKAMRLAVALEQKHCQHPGCGTAASMCHVHHPTPWSRGGGTSVRNAQLLCPRHHALAHRDQPMRT